MTTGVLFRLAEVDIEAIVPNPWQPRTSMDPAYIEELQESILAVGLLQEPLGRELDDGTRPACLRAHQG